MSGTLFVVATPIGNLEDVTLRALRVLREVDLIAAEDTRRTARLLAHHGIATPTQSFHAHNANARVPQLVERLRSGQRVALVTDAGTPGISDPGAELVRASAEAGIAIDPVPGVSAPLAAAIASGFPLIPLTIFGFPPIKSKDRTAWFSAISEVSHAVTFFEAPHRIRRTMVEAGQYLGKRQIMVARELTKVHQEFLRGTAEDLAGMFDSPRGEFTIVIGPSEEAHQTIYPVSSDSIINEFWQLTDSGVVTRREAVSSLAKKHRLSARDVYRMVEEAKQSGN
jgi:16S rRNA (cytidine1402-2'-O)-methyltransferase